MNQKLPFTSQHTSENQREGQKSTKELILFFKKLVCNMVLPNQAYRMLVRKWAAHSKAPNTGYIANVSIAPLVSLTTQSKELRAYQLHWIPVIPSWTNHAAYAQNSHV